MKSINIDDLEVKDLKVIFSVLKEFAWGFNFYTSEKSLQELGVKIENLEVILDNLKKNFKAQHFFEEWGCYDDTQMVRLSEEEINISIRALDKIFNYLEGEDIDTRIGYASIEIKKVKRKLEDFLNLISGS